MGKRDLINEIVSPNSNTSFKFFRVYIPRKGAEPAKSVLFGIFLRPLRLCVEKLLSNPS